MSDVEKHDLSHHLEQAVQELDADSIGLAHNMYDATLEQLHEIVSFADRLKEGALVEMYLRERKVRIPRPSGHLFHKHPATDSTMIRPPIPRSSGHP
ncbi:hypothetical protein [Pseudomonas aeruginosa]|uniref:hypothetical protein n=1 Tax=Pseudomonas aeruginosa TaxID=287 RepID=UPI002E2DA69A|nr:hypothetical protein [Pseudomonas aeruginosa]